MKKQPTGGKRLVAYYRYSGGSHQTEQSIEGQRRDCETYARIHGMVILHEYIDRHISGKTDDRPESATMAWNCSMPQKPTLKAPAVSS